MSPTGYCRPFDTAANGYSRSETVAVMYLQKAKNAKRIYAICPHIKINNDGYKEEGITYPSTLLQSTLLQEFYDECQIPTSRLDYIEAHGTGTKVGDPEEINAINKVFCKNRETPLMIGSVKSNLGHAEAASGLTQIAKVKQIFLHLFLFLNLFLSHTSTQIGRFILCENCSSSHSIEYKNLLKSHKNFLLIMEIKHKQMMIYDK